MFIQRCVFCQGELDPTTRFCRACGREQPAGPASMSDRLSGVSARGVRQGLGGKLPGTVPSKIITAILVIAVVATSSVAAIIVAKGGVPSVPSITAHQSTAITSRTPKVPTPTSRPAGMITVFPLLTSESLPFGITAGPDGNLWFTECISNAGSCSYSKIGRITPNGQITEFPLPTPTKYNEPHGITAGPDGNLWFTEEGNGQIGYTTS